LGKFQEYLPIYEGDRYCLMCSQACPVRRVTGKEATSPHGWALLVASVNRGLLQWNAETVDVLYRCSDCGNCQGNCATDRPLPYAIQAARAEVTRLGHAPTAVKGIEEKFRAWSNPYAEPPKADTAQVLKDAWNALTAKPGRDAAPQKAVLLFVGDAAYHLRPQAVEAAEKLIRAAGGTPVRFHEGRSSGYLPYALGLWDTAQGLAQEVALALQLSGPARVVVLGTQDAHALKHLYAELGVTLPDHVNLSTLVEYLATATAGDKLKLRPRASQPYTYHDPSQAVRLKGHGLNARVLATEVMGEEPREMLFRETVATPSGTSGGLIYTQPALAASLARTRVREALETGAKILLTDDPLDTVQLSRYADGLQVLNLFEVMAEQLADTG
jgi:Fe-S oxidoreductase